ncbi:MAG: stage V sporulation protein AC [Firmicutes bacterium]|nr:stage V sporulation protein AC [Bacillota bacterium]
MEEIKVNIKSKDYKRYADAAAKKSPCAKNCAAAFLVGGLICTIAGALTDIYSALGANTENAGIYSTVTLIFLAALLTGVGVFDDIAKFAGAGTLVPITGFANAVVSPAIDTKSEGWIFGVGANIFKIAGPVVLYGTFSGAIYGVIYYIYTVISH